MPRYVLLHASLKLGRAEDGSAKMATLGDTVELPEAFVAENDPKGVSFIPEAKYAALRDQVIAIRKAEKAIGEKAAELQSEKEKLEAKKLNAKHLAAVEAIEAKRAEEKAPAKAAHPEDKKGGGAK